MHNEKLLVGIVAILGIASLPTCATPRRYSGMVDFNPEWTLPQLNPWDFMGKDGREPRPFTRRIRLVTFNVAQESPSGVKIRNLLISRQMPSVVVVALQEIAAAPKDLAKGTHTDWAKAIKALMYAMDFEKIKNERLVGMQMLVFARRSMVADGDIKHVESDKVLNGMGGAYGNKGGVVMSLVMYGKRIALVNSHLAAHDKHVQKRIDDYDDITKARLATPLLDHDIVFWMGDLNFRIDRYSIDKVREVLATPRDDYADLQALQAEDQLRKVMASGAAFSGFKEPRLHFKPTYRFFKQSRFLPAMLRRPPAYDYYRKPAWCDRILVKVLRDNQGNSMTSLRRISYAPVPGYVLSDHVPLASEFDIIFE